MTAAQNHAAPEVQRRVIDAVERQYGQSVVSFDRLPKGMGTVNWRLRTNAGEYFLKQYPPAADLPGEAAALETSQRVRAAGIPAPLVLEAADGRLLWTGGDLAFALFEFVDGATSGVALSHAQMAQAGAILGRLHAYLRTEPPPLRDITDEWLVIDETRKRQQLEKHLDTIARREVHDDFDRRTTALLHRRIELLPRIKNLLASLPPLTRQLLHGDYSVWNILFHGDELVAVVDFRPPERFLPAFEIGRAALNPETLAAGAWLDKAVAFAEEYCAANREIARADVELAPHVWLGQLVRSEYGVKQHYVAPLEYQADLDRFWFQRCEAAELILANLQNVSAAFAAAWEHRHGR